MRATINPKYRSHREWMDRPACKPLPHHPYWWYSSACCDRAPNSGCDSILPSRLSSTHVRCRLFPPRLVAAEVYYVAPRLSISEYQLALECFFRRVAMASALVNAAFRVWADLVGDSQTFNVGKSRPRLFERWLICGRRESLGTIGSLRGRW